MKQFSPLGTDLLSRLTSEATSMSLMKKGVKGSVQSSMGPIVRKGFFIPLTMMINHIPHKVTEKIKDFGGKLYPN